MMPRPCRALSASAILLLLAGAAARDLGAQRVENPRAGVTTQGTRGRATGVIDGAITDTALRPIGFAEVTVLRTDIKLLSNSLGRFRFVDVPAGQYLLIVRRIGFRPVSSIIQVGNRDTLRLAFTLEPSVQVMGEVVITEERHS